MILRKRVLQVIVGDAQSRGPKIEPWHTKYASRANCVSPPEKQHLKLDPQNSQLFFGVTKSSYSSKIAIQK